MQAFSTILTSQGSQLRGQLYRFNKTAEKTQVTLKLSTVYNAHAGRFPKSLKLEHFLYATKVRTCEKVATYVRIPLAASSNAANKSFGTRKFSRLLLGKYFYFTFQSGKTKILLQYSTKQCMVLPCRYYCSRNSNFPTCIHISVLAWFVCLH